MYPCLAATAAIVVLLVDVSLSPRFRFNRKNYSRKSPIQSETRTRAGGGKGSNDDSSSNSGHLQQQVTVRSSGVTPGRLKSTLNGKQLQQADQLPTTQQHQAQVQTSASRLTQDNYPIEVFLSSVGLIDGRNALRVGNRFHPHTDGEGNVLSWWRPESRTSKNYNGLDITFLAEENFRRQIHPNPDDAGSEYYGRYEIWDGGYDAFENEIERNWNQYQALDDDAVRSEVHTHMNSNRECIVPDWYKLQFPTCNAFHEMTIMHSNSDNRFLGRGFYRMVFSIQEKNQPWYILKVMRWQEEKKNLFTRSMVERTRLDALVMERLASSPRITDMYGFCSASIMTEPLPGEVWKEAVPTKRVVDKGEFNDKDEVDTIPKNPYTPTEKIKMALEMAEALADLHGFKDGMIVHNDLDPGQYLRTQDGRMKLNDFNCAKPQLYDTITGKYCKYYNGEIGGKFRSPEEFVPTVLDEKIDIFSLGNSFYGILTGLWPLYYSHNEVAQEKLVKGQMPYINKHYRTRSYAEGALVKAIEMCHHRQPEDRADIFTIVKHLRDAVEVNDEHIENE